MTKLQILLLKEAERQGSQRQAAAKLGITMTSFFGYTTGTTEPRLSTMIELSKRFNVPLQSLLDEEGIETDITDEMLHLWRKFDAETKRYWLAAMRKGVVK